MTSPLDAVQTLLAQADLPGDLRQALVRYRTYKVGADDGIYLRLLRAELFGLEFDDCPRYLDDNTRLRDGS